MAKLALDWDPGQWNKACLVCEKINGELSVAKYKL